MNNNKRDAIGPSISGIIAETKNQFESYFKIRIFSLKTSVLCYIIVHVFFVSALCMCSLFQHCFRFDFSCFSLVHLLGAVHEVCV